MTVTITKGPIGEQDLNRFDGVNSTFTRLTSTGNTETLNRFDGVVDALMVYGAGTVFTQATIDSALTAIGTTNKIKLVLRPGTWTINANKDWSAYTNVTFKVLPGALISHGAFTLSIPNVEAGPYAIFSGAGAITFTGSQYVWPQWNGGTGSIQLTSPLAANYGGSGTNLVTGYAKASLPAPGATTNGRLAKVTNTIRGLWMDTTTHWVGLNGEVVNVKEFGAEGDGSTVDTVAVEAAIVAANAAGLTYDKPTLYFPAGVYIVGSNTLSDIKTNVYGPDATIQCDPTETGTEYILSVDYTSTVGQRFELRAIHGPLWPTTTLHKAGLQINGSDNSTFIIHQFESLDTCISLAGNLADHHIAQNTFFINTMMSFNKGINLTAGVDVQNETNTFNIEYLQQNIADSIGIYISNSTGTNTYATNNRFCINTVEPPATGTVVFRLTGTTPAKVLQNYFEVKCNLALPGAGGAILNADASIGVNFFRLPQALQLYVAYLTYSSIQIFTMPNNVADSRSVVRGTTTPASGYWQVGDVCWNTAPASGGTPGWVCTTAGSPGTWKAMANLA